MKHRDASLKDNETIQALPLACADEKAAVELIEAKVWGGEPRCPHCEDRNVYQMTDRKTGQRNKRFLWRCRACKKQFTVRIGTIFQDSKVPLRHWCWAIWQMCAAKKGVSALQIRRQTAVSYKTALFMLHRIRWAMSQEGGMLGGPGKIIEADETWVGGKPRHRRYGHKYKGHSSKVPVMALVERGGDVHLRPIERVTSQTVGRVLMEKADTGSRLMTDQHKGYLRPGRRFDGGHQSVDHSSLEYARGDAHNNTAESVFSLLKRGLMGTFHSVSKQHLHRYLAEFEFRWNTRVMDDGARVAEALRAARGKRLCYASE